MAEMGVRRGAFVIRERYNSRASAVPNVSSTRPDARPVGPYALSLLRVAGAAFFFGLGAQVERFLNDRA
jgi:hypothetical protein